MKKIISKLTVLTAALFICGCQSPTPNIVPPGDGETGGTGKLTVKLERNGEYSISSKADIAIDENKFLIQVVNPSGVVVLSKNYGDLDPVEGIPAGLGYTVKATYGSDVDAAFDSPYYYGESKLDVLPDIINTVLVESKVANMKVTVDVSDKFKTFYGTDYEIFVRNESYVKDGDPQLVFAPSETRSGYLKPGKIIVKVRGRQTIKTFEIPNGKAADHHVITVDLTSTANMSTYITIDHTLNNVDSEIIVPSDDETLGNGGVEDPGFGGEDTPGEGGGDGEDTDLTPKLTGDGFDIDQTLILKLGTDIIIENNVAVCVTPVKAIITAPGKVEELIVTIVSDELAPLLPPLFGGPSFDIANPTEAQRANLEAFTILKPGEIVKGVKEYTFDVTNFMGLLGTNNGQPHNFQIQLKDSFGQIINKTLSVQITE